MTISLVYIIVIHWILSCQAKNVDLAKMTVTVNCSSSPNWMAPLAVWVSTEAEINIMLTMILFQKHFSSRDRYDEAFSGQIWLCLLTQCLALNSCSRNLCWINKLYKGYFGLLRSEQYLPLFWCWHGICTPWNMHSCTLAQWLGGKWYRKISIAFLRRASNTIL